MEFINRQGRALLLSAAAVVVAFGAHSASAQAKLTVSKSPGDAAMFSNVQAAVNTAKPGDVIEILDAGVYEEQVTIDSSKSGITLRSKDPASLVKPVIKWRDTQNTSPKNRVEAGILGYGPGTSGNFDVCGALRIFRAQDVTVDGIAVDGGSPFVFGANQVWCDAMGASCSGNFSGNAAVILFTSGGARIRNCELRNAYFGIRVKDRNTGGVFASPGGADNDMTIPGAGFGKAGGHLLEYNHVHDNAVGFNFESAWDLGSTVRYNLIYNNYYTPTVRSDVMRLGVESDNQHPGAFLFKDDYLSPLAIYNNTFHNNYVVFIGNWRIGGQHLVFNNIFGQSSGAATGNSTSYAYMMIEHKFPNRMKNSVFSVYDRSNPSSLNIQSDSYLCADNPDNPYSPVKSFVSRVRVGGYYSFPEAAKTSVTLDMCDNGQRNGQKENVQMVLSGAVISGKVDGGGTIPADANIRWLEMAGGTFGSGVSSTTLPSLFQSTDPTSPNFLEPQWSHQSVINFIKNKGWPESGIRNPDGTLADLGALPSSSAKRHTVTARVKPTSIIRVTGTSAAANFNISAEGGALNNPRIKYLKWIYPIPDNGPGYSSGGSWGANFAEIPADAVKDVAIPSTALKTGANALTFTIPSAITDTATSYGFFEMTVEGTDASGNTVTSDVGFLPYRGVDAEVTLRYTTGDGGTVTGTLTQTVASGGNGSEVTAAAGAGYKFVSWSDGVTTAARTDRNVVFGVDVSAVFALLEPVSLIYNAGYGGVVTGTVVQTIAKGGDGESVRAVPNARYAFVSWSDGVTTATRRDLGVQADITVTATFGVSSYNLSYSAGSGGRLMGTATQTVTPGADGSAVVALPNEGYVFVSWSDGVTTAERVDANVRVDITVTAIFEASAFTLKYTAGSGGGITGAATQTVTPGSSGSAVTAVPEEGYVFTSWSDGVTTAERTDKNVTANITVTANFSIDKCTLRYRLGEGGKSLIGDSVQVVNFGGNGKEVYAVAETGYTFARWSDGSTDNPRIDSGVTGAMTLTAYFADPDGNVSVNAGDRVVPQPNTTGVVAVAPVPALTAEFTAGPNPASVGNPSGMVNFFYAGGRIKSGTLSVYDATGNLVNKIEAASTAEKRRIASWNLTDKKGRPVPYGAYLVRGVVKTRDGKSEKVSAVVGVR